LYPFRLLDFGGDAAWADSPAVACAATSGLWRRDAVPDKAGTIQNVVLGFPSLEGYLNDTCYIGSTIGRYANRIGGARFVLNDKVYELEKNDNGNNNHGGNCGFHRRVFDFTIHEDGVSFTLSSKDGEGGFPGQVELKVTYRWNERQELEIRYTASTDRPTVLNFTNHAYFNLSGLSRDVFEHWLSIRSQQVLEATDQYIPTGVVLPAKEKSFQNTLIQDRISKVDGKIRGLNTYYILEPEKKEQDPACVLTEPLSGRLLEVFTTYPGVQLYTGDFLASHSRNHHSDSYKPFDGLCLECQYYPDSPNHSHFPDTVLNPGEIYHEKITYRFSVSKSFDHDSI
jgi:aldose 1-epimerase